MKKLILTLSSMLLLTSTAIAGPYSRSNTIKINLENIPIQAIQQIKPQTKELIKSEIDLTNVVVFARGWQDNNSRKVKILDLCSNVVSKAFDKYPQSKEFEFSTYVSYKDRLSHKNQTKKLSTIVITKDSLKKINWKDVNNNPKKYFKSADFSDL